MKAAFFLFSLVLLALASIASADPQNQPPVAPVQAVTATATPAAPPASSVDLFLQKLFEPQKPVRRAATCYDNAYEYCQTFCSELSQTNGCDFFANQECLCERFPADCPVCY
jgi:hypothetical protein